MSEGELCLTTTSAIVTQAYSLPSCPRRLKNKRDEIICRWERLERGQAPRPASPASSGRTEDCNPPLPSHQQDPVRAKGAGHAPVKVLRKAIPLLDAHLRGAQRRDSDGRLHTQGLHTQAHRARGRERPSALWGTDGSTLGAPSGHPSGGKEPDTCHRVAGRGDALLRETVTKDTAAGPHSRGPPLPTGPRCTGQAAAHGAGP